MNIRRKKKEANTSRLNPEAEVYILIRSTSCRRRQHEEESSSKEGEEGESESRHKKNRQMRKEAEAFIPENMNRYNDGDHIHASDIAMEGERDLIGNLVSGEEEGSQMQNDE